jgi:hypothetical protein
LLWYLHLHADSVTVSFTLQPWNPDIPSTAAASQYHLYDVDYITDTEKQKVLNHENQSEVAKSPESQAVREKRETR